jgi:predicted small lipoprotein YifL
MKRILIPALIALGLTAAACGTRGVVALPASRLTNDGPASHTFLG